MAMKRRGTVPSERLQMIGSAIAFVAGKGVLRIDHLPFFHSSVAMRFGKDGGSGNGNAAGVAFDERLLLDENVELHRVNKQIIRLDRELLKGSGHGLAAGLIEVPGVDALGIDFSDGPVES